jgi:flavin-dependent dehydrogenase
MHDLLIIGAGPGGIALAAEAFASGIDPSRILILEKGPTHNSAIRQLYPEQKLTTADLMEESPPLQHFHHDELLWKTNFQRLNC